ncbi:MAG TPA: hypothetical protein VE404_00460 [Verrucomicrobiae bacterium]|nr:hypothetical protein [Verrucomicrobiae bacterium]
MASSASPGGSLIGIRSSKRPDPPSGAPAEISVVLPLSAGAPDPAGTVARLLAGLAGCGEPFELIVVGEGELPSGDPRIRRAPCPAGSDLGARLLAGVRGASTDFILPALAGRAPAAGEVTMLRDAMDSSGAFSYLPGSRAADVAIVVGARTVFRNLVVYGLVGVFASDFAGPMLARRSLFDAVHVAGATTPEILLGIVAQTRRAGGVVRTLRDPAPGGARLPVPIADAWRVRARLRTGP